MLTKHDKVKKNSKKIYNTKCPLYKKRLPERLNLLLLKVLFISFINQFQRKSSSESFYKK